MLETKRKHKKNIKKKIIKVCLTAVLILALFAISLFIYTKLPKKPLYISPLAANFSTSNSSGKDKKIAVLKNLLHQKNISYKDLTLNGADITLHLDDKSVIILSSGKDINTQLASLQVILSRLTMEGKSFSQLDLRFDRPVIRLK